MDTLRRMVAGLLLLIVMSRSALTMDAVDLHGNFSDPTKDRDSNYSKVTCDFAHGTCGWENVGGDAYPLTWERKKDGYMHLYMDGAGDSKGRLASPWLRPLPSHRCKLSFQYYIQKAKPDSCWLSLYRQTWSGEEEMLWSTQRGILLGRFSDFINKPVNCTAGIFRMVFEGWKDCGWFAYFNEIDVRSIKFIVYPEDARPPTDPTPSGVFTIEHVSADHGGSTEPPGKGDNSGGGGSSRSQPDPGLLAGIIVTVVVAVVIVGVLIVVIVIVPRRRRRRRQQRDQKDPVSQRTSGTTTNSTHRLGRQHAAGNGGTDSRGRHPHTTRADNYELAVVPPAVVPDDTYDHTSRTGALPPAAMPLEDTYDHTSPLL